MQDMVAGSYRVPWEAEVMHKDGTSCGFAEPTRPYAGPDQAPGAASRSRRVA
jgi:formamidase